MNNTISACILAKNEEKHIKDCILSIRDIVDEIIVVDNGSSDKTVEICKFLGCKVLDGSNLMLDEGRKLYLKEATKDWIIILDADERFLEGEKGKLKSILTSISEDIWGLETLSYQYIGFGKWSEVFLLRIIRNNKLIHYNNSAIHSSMAPSIRNNNAKIINIDEVAIHHLDILIKDRPNLKREKYKNLLIDVIYNKSENINFDMFNLYKCFLGLEFVACNEYDKAEKLYIDAYSEDFLYKGFALQCLCQMYLYKNDIEKVKPYMVSENIELLKNSNVLGNYYYYYTDKKSCIELYETLIVNSPNTASNYINLAFLLKDMEKDKSRKLFIKALEINPYLKNKKIYNKGYKPNLFDIQSSMLNEITDLKLLIEELNLENEVFNNELI